VTLPPEELVGVRAVDARVASDAVLEAGLGNVVEAGSRRGDAAFQVESETHDVVVALKAQREGGGAREEARVGRAVRLMARRAPFHANGRMLVNERAAFVGVAVGAGDVVAERRPHHARRLGRAPGRHRRTVRVVAVGAKNGALVHAMTKRQFELGANLKVAGVAGLALGGCEQRPFLLGTMDRVAGDATDLAGRVGGATDLHLAEVGGMASQATVQDGRRLEFGKDDDLGLVSGVGDVEPAGSVTPLAAGSRFRLIFHCEGTKVRIAVESLPDIGVACLTGPAADVRVLLGRLGAERKQGGGGEQDQPLDRRSDRQRTLSLNPWSPKKFCGN